MDLHPYIDDIHRQLAVAAEAGGDEARALAERLAAPLDAAIRLALQDALAAAAEEITVELAPGSVELRLRGREPEFVVTAPGSLGPLGPLGPRGPRGPERRPDERDAAIESAGQAAERGPVGAGPLPAGEPAPGAGDGDEGAIWRINLRLPLHMKSRIEHAASRDGLSLNTWLQRAASAALEPAEPPRHERRAWTGGERFTGWVR